MRFEQATSHGRGLSIFRPGSPGAVALLRAVWPTVVGVELGHRTEVLGIVENTLRVGVPDARWRVALHKLRGRILRGLRESVGGLAPDRLGFVEGWLSTQPLDAPPVPRETPSREETLPSTLTQEAQAIVDPELRAAFLATAARYLARARMRG